MSPQELALLASALAVPGLLLRRTQPLVARFCALLALLGVGLAVLDLPRVERTRRAPLVVAVPAVGEGAASIDALRRHLGADPTLAVEAGAAPAPHRLARARLRRRQDPRLALLWTAGIDRPGAAGRRIPAAALTDVAAAVVDPDRISVTQAAPAAVGRPAALDVDLGAVPDGFAGTLRVVGPDGTAVVEVPLRERVQRVAWRPVAAGRHTLALELTVGGHRLAGEGRVEVLGALGITVIGRGAENLVAALKVQGIPAEHRERLPEEPGGVLVMLGPLDAATQTRVDRFLRDGGGVFLVGDPDGGAIPAPGEPLDPASPVLRLPQPAPTGKEGEGTGKGEGRVEEEPPAQPEKPDPPSEKPNENASGDTTGAKLRHEEMEVERRSIAMVLVIDHSGSMSESVRPGATRMDLARASALQTAMALDDEQDQLGVVSFGDPRAAHVVLPLVPVTRKAEIRSKLRALRARMSRTNLRDGLLKARKMLKGAKADVKHVVVITDGVIDDVGEGLAESAARRLGNDGVTLCVVQILSPGIHAGFGGSAKITTDLVKLAKGYLIQQSDFSKVPRVVSAEVQKQRTKAGRKPPSKDKGEESTEPPPEKPEKEPEPEPPKPEPEPPKPEEKILLEVRKIEDSPLLAPDAVPFPGVAGVLPSRARPAARTLLVAGEEGIPLLAFANRGLGRIGVFTAGFLGDWGGAWVADPEFPGRLGQWLQHLAPALPRSAPRDALRAPELTPRAPLPREISWIADWTGEPLRDVGAFVAPSPTIEATVHGQAVGHARYGLLLLLLLVGVEFLVRRKSFSS